MIRPFAALLIAGCLTFPLWAQTPPSQTPAGQNPAAEPAPATSGAASAQASTEPPKKPAATETPTPSPEDMKDPSPWDKFKEFSAISVGSPLPDNADPAHLYRSGNMVRVEGRMGKSYQLTDLTTRQSHGLSTTGCLKYSYPYTRTFPFSYLLPGTKFKRTPVGEETVDGHKCKVEDVQVLIPKYLSPSKWRLWEAEDLDGFPIQLQFNGPRHAKMLWRNVVLGPQDPTLFIVPEKCQMLDDDAVTTGPKGKKAPAKKP